MSFLSKSKAPGGLHIVHHVHFGLCIMVSIVVFGAILLSSNVEKIATAAPPSAPANKNWQQVWADEFNAGSLDSNKWNVDNNSNYGAANHEDQCYRSANVGVSGGALRLTAKRETVSCGATNPDTGNNTYYFTSGMVTTRAQGGPMKYKFKQGYVETRVKAPKGNPYWPAFWLVGPNDGSTPGWPDYGEFDVFELYGARPDITNGTLHYKCTKGDGHCKTAPTWYNLKTNSAYGGSSTLGTHITSQSGLDAYSGGTTDYNIYGFLWESNKISWLVNGRLYRYFDGTNLYRVEQNGAHTLEGSTSTLGAPAIPFSTVFNYDHSIIFNLAVGGDGPRYSYYGYTGQDTAGGFNNGNYAAVDPGVMEIDYVRVYQLADVTPPPVDPPPTPPTTPPPAVIPPPSSNTPAPVVTSPSGEKVEVAQDGSEVSGNAVLDSSIATDKELQKEIEKVEYYVDGVLKQTVTKPPFQLDTKQLANGTYKITETIYFKNGTKKASTATITIANEVRGAPQKEESAKNMSLAIWLGAGLVLLAGVAYLFAVPRWRSGIIAAIQHLVNRFNQS